METVLFPPVLSPADVERATQLIQRAYAPVPISSADQNHIQQELFEIQKHPQAWGLVVPFLEHSDPNVQFFGAHTAQVKIARDCPILYFRRVCRTHSMDVRQVKWSSRQLHTFKNTFHCMVNGHRLWPVPSICNKMHPSKNIVQEETLSLEHRFRLRELLLELTSRSIMREHSKTILRKLFVALVSLALHLAPLSPTQWSDWIFSTVGYLSQRGASSGPILDFLAIVAEEVGSADLVGGKKARMQQSLQDAIPLVVQAVTASITRPRQPGTPSDELRSALKCLDGWMPNLPGNDLTLIIPLLIDLLNPFPPTNPGSGVDFDGSAFVPATEALEEVMSKSALSDGSGSKSLTEPLLAWCQRWGGHILEITSKDSGNPTSHAFCKFLVAIGDHSSSYLAANVTSPRLVTVTAGTNLTSTRAQLVQNFLRLLLAFTGLPGVYGVDEEESEMTLGFWYIFQEALWNAEYNSDGWESSSPEGEPVGSEKEKELWVVVKVVYSELVRALRRKVIWPGRDQLDSWNRDQKDIFYFYRRDVGDTLINAYYVLRGDMLEFYINDILEQLATRQERDGWESIEGTLHCINAIQEAIPLEPNPHLSVLFGPEILGKLPTTGHDRVRRTMLCLIGSYSSWFTTQTSEAPSAASSLLMNAVFYVVTALLEPALCLQAANALRDLCDSNRAALALHMGAFAELHANISGIADTEKSKVLQSIASVIQALPPQEEISPVEAIVTPVIQKLVETIHSSAHLPDEARAVAIMQLRTIAGVAKGLTRTADSLLILDDSPEDLAECNRMEKSRNDLRMIELRNDLFAAIRSTLDLWSTDAGVSDAIGDLFKSITSLPSDATLISLPAGPLLELVCLALKRHLTAVWLSLASMLIVQLDPPSLLLPSLKSDPNPEAHAVIANVLPVLLETCLTFLGQPGAMEANPDIVQAFFGCMDTVAVYFLKSFYGLPPGALDALLQCAISSLALQERYSLVSACTFLATLINRTSNNVELTEAKEALVQSHGRAILRALLNGFACVAPRSAMQNLIELLSCMVSHCLQQCRVWMPEILFDGDFVRSKAGPEAKETFIKAVISSRSLKRTREAAQQFMLIARGLEGTSFGYATVSM